MHDNLIVIVVDQLRADAVAASHDASHPTAWTTPNIGALCRTGTRYANAFTAAPVCNPARHSMLTGLYPSQHDVVTNRHTPVDGLRTIAHLAGDSGIETVCVGNNGWRGSYPDGFARTVGTSSFDETLGERAREVFAAENQRHMRRTAGGPSPRGVEEYKGHFAAQHASSELERLAASGSRFFLWCNIPEPHPPFRPPADTYRRALASMDGRPSGERTDRPSPYMRELSREWDHLSEHEWLQLTAAYHGMVSLADRFVGMIVDTLAHTGLDERTAVVLVADHGEMLGEHGLMLKFNFRESAVRVPLVVSRPGGRATVSNRLTSGVDVFATAADLLGLPAPGDVPGRSVLREEPHDVVHSFLGDHEMVTDGRWKLVTYGDGSQELFDLDADPNELRNLIDAPEAAAHRQRLAAQNAP